MDVDTHAELAAERQARQAAEAERDFYRSVLQQAPIALNVHLGADLKFQVVHPQMKLFGGDALKGTRADDLVGDPGHQQVLAAAKIVFETGISQRFEALEREIHEGNGQRRKAHFHFALSRLEGPGGEPLGVIIQFCQIGATSAVWRWFQGILDTLPLGVALSDASSGRLLYTNRTARQIAESSKAHAQSLDSLDALRLSDGRPDGGDFTVAMPHGERTYRSSTWTVPANAAVPATLVEIAEDVTALRTAEASVDNAGAASKRQAEAIAHLAHELRQPLGSIIGFAELGAAEKLSEAEAHDFWLRIHRAGMVALNLANDYLAAAVDAADIAVANSAFDPAALTREVVQTFDVLAIKKHIRVRLGRGIEWLPSTFVSDPVRLRQILTNLLANALKFTDTGSISVDAAVSTDATSGKRRLFFSVADTGIGMSLEQQERLFEPFERGHGAAANRPGAGLGLNLSRRLAVLLGGELRLQRSCLGVGSCFEFSVLEREA